MDRRSQEIEIKDLADEVEAPHVSYVSLQTSRGFWSAFMTNLREAKMFKLLDSQGIFKNYSRSQNTNILIVLHILHILNIPLARILTSDQSCSTPCKVSGETSRSLTARLSLNMLLHPTHIDTQSDLHRLSKWTSLHRPIPQSSTHYGV
jgi:hypothetical protein